MESPVEVLDLLRDGYDNMALGCMLRHTTAILAADSHSDVFEWPGARFSPLQVDSIVILQLLRDFANLKLDGFEGVLDLLHLSLKRSSNATFTISSLLTQLALKLNNLAIRIV